MLAEAAHRESRFGYIPFDREKTRRVVEQALAEDRRHLIAVAEVRGQVEGFVFASAGEYLYGSGVLIVTINTVYTSQRLRGSLLGGRAALGLFRAVGRWSKGIGAREILLHTTTGNGGGAGGEGCGTDGVCSSRGCVCGQDGVILLEFCNCERKTESRNGEHCNQFHLGVV